MLYISEQQLEMFKALNKVMKTNQEYLESLEPSDWENSPSWSELVLEIKKVKCNWVTQKFQQDIYSTIQL